MSAGKLPEWPTLSSADTLEDHYEKIVAFWESRCRHLVDGVNRRFDGTTHWDGCEAQHWHCRLLKEIGPLPGKQP